jgi:hypothetical protein
VYAAAQISALCLLLSPVALAIVFWYSVAKRYSSYTQLFLGLAMAVAPVGGWIAAGGREGLEPWLLGMAIGLWVGGFDILYACQDFEFDRWYGLRSIPTRFGFVGRRISPDARGDHHSHGRALAVGSPAAYWWRGGGRVPAGVRAVARQRKRSLTSQEDNRPEQLRGIIDFAATALSLFFG